MYLAIDYERREAIRKNHTATHLLHAALRQQLGTHVTQKGSLVAPDRLRFDFSHYVPLTESELESIERLVNGWIRANTPSEARVMGYDSAIEAGAIALFGEKYGDEVRVMRIGDVSTELCGGTHVARSGDIGLFKIIAETGIAAGVRRIEALTGAAALEWVEGNDDMLRELAAVLKTGRDELPDKVRQLIERGRKLEKDIERLQQRLASGSGEDLADGAQSVDGIQVVARRLDGLDAKALRAAVDQLKSRLGSAAIVLGSAIGDDKVVLIAGVTKDQTRRLSAGDLVNAVAQQVGGRGGGRADMAQAGGSDPSRLDAALDSVPQLVRARLG